MKRLSPRTSTSTIGALLLLSCVGVPWVAACGSSDDGGSSSSGGDAGVTPTPTPTPTTTTTTPQPPPPAPTCTDKIKNGSEADVDCGGSCPTKCADGKGCSVAADCATATCSGGKCVAAACVDTVKNGTETDVDCGGTCGKCADTKTCAVAADCTSAVCDATTKKCLAPLCTDTVKNGTESDVDCGGTCPNKCADTKSCAVAADCTSGVCNAGTKKCSAAICTDLAKNGTETDVDCGGTCATKCADTKSCLVGTDCTSGVCDAGTHKCSVPACPDGVKNGGETDLDCGGANCATKCAIGKTCAVSTDCDKAICTALACRVGASCKEIKTAVPGSASGVYTIDPDGAGGVDPFQAYCDMTNDGGGWTLAIKADGAQTTLGYDSALWTNTTLLNPDKPDLDTNEAKLQSFNGLAFTEVRVAITDAAVTRSVIIPKVATSLADVFNPTVYQASLLGRAAWKGIMAAGSLQVNCNQEGFSSNPAPGNPAFARVRIGIVSNQENDCNSPDSWIGVGGFGAPCGGDPNTSVGNVATCGGDVGDVNVKAFGYVMVR
jgi:hypothetical protein